MSKNKGVKLNSILGSSMSDKQKQLIKYRQKECSRLGIKIGFDIDRVDTNTDIDTQFSSVYKTQEDWENDCNTAMDYISKMQKVPKYIEYKLIVTKHEHENIKTYT